MIWLKQKKMSEVAKAFLFFIKQNKDAVYKKNFAWLDNYNE